MSANEPRISIPLMSAATKTTASTTTARAIAAIMYPMTIPPRFGAASMSLRAKPNSKSAAIAKPVKTPPNAAAWMQTKPN